MATFQGIPGFGAITSSANPTQGIPPFRTKAVFESGTIIDSGSAGPIPPAGGVVGIQSTASITNQIVSTSSNALQNASMIYIPVTTGGLNGAVAPPYTGCGTPLIWNDNTATLMVWSSGKGSWMTQVVGTSFAAGNTTFTTS